MTDFSSLAEAIRRLTEVELDAILLREVCHSRQNWQRDGDWHDWIEISPDERERLVAAAKSVAQLTAQVETLQAQVAAQNKETVRAWECQAADRKSALANYAKLREAETQVTALRALLRDVEQALEPDWDGGIDLHKTLRQQIRAALGEKEGL